MGANATLSTFVTGTVASSSVMNSNLNAIDNVTRFYHSHGSLKGIFSVNSASTNVPTNFTNSLGVRPDFGVGCASSGAFHLVCWNENLSSSTVVNVVPDPANGGLHWSIVFLQF